MHRHLFSVMAVCLALAVFACDQPGDESSAGEGGESTETAAEVCADRPMFPEVYSSCAGAGHCGTSDNTCASQTGMDPVSNQAFCTQSCYEDSDCPVVEGTCTAQVVCVAPGGGQGVCALDCAEGRQCPDNMMCLSDLDPAMPRDLCF